MALLEGALMTLLVSACGLLIGAAIGGDKATRVNVKLLDGGDDRFGALFVEKHSGGSHAG